MNHTIKIKKSNLDYCWLTTTAKDKISTTEVCIHETGFEGEEFPYSSGMSEFELPIQWEFLGGFPLSIRAAFGEGRKVVKLEPRGEITSFVDEPYKESIYTIRVFEKVENILKQLNFVLNTLESISVEGQLVQYQNLLYERDIAKKAFDYYYQIFSDYPEAVSILDYGDLNKYYQEDKRRKRFDHSKELNTFKKIFQAVTEENSLFQWIKLLGICPKLIEKQNPTFPLTQKQRRMMHNLSGDKHAYPYKLGMFQRAKTK